MFRYAAIVFLLMFSACTKNKKLGTKDLYEDLDIPVSRDFKLSEKVNACEDFHDYVCSEVEDNFKLPDDRERWMFSFSDNAEKLLHAKKEFFKKIDKHKLMHKRSDQFKNVYSACMNEGASITEEKTFVSSEVEALTDIRKSEELIKLSADRVDQGQESFIGFSNGVNKQDPSIHDVYIYAGMKSLPERSYYENKELIADFKIVLTDFFKTVGMDNPEKRASEVIEFETDFAVNTPLPKQMRGRSTEKRDIDRTKFLEKYPKLNFEKIMDQIPENTIVVDIIPEANEFMSNAVTKYPLETLKSVYAFHSMSGYLDDAYPDFFNKYFDFKAKYLGGPKKRPVRQERCTQLAMNLFGMEIDYELIDILFPDFPEKRAIEMGKTLRASIIKGIESNKWLTKEAKAEAVKKIKTAKLDLVKPQKDEDWDFMPIKEYSKDKPYQNMITYNKASYEQSLSDLKKPRNSNEWLMSPLTVNAYYMPPDNKFVLPIGILQFPFFSKDMTDVENIGAIGVVIGHELGHGIDDQGSKYDFEGKVRNWFSEKDAENFKKRGAQFIKQFEDIGHDGKLTLGENIGDHVGITFAYDAAFPNAKNANKELKQKFFIAYARLWCGVQTESSALKRLKTDPHSSGQERINQQVIHINGFYDAFECKKGDKMFVEPNERIRIW